MLALSAGDVVGTDRLVDALWGASPPRSSVKVVQNLVLRLRKVLGAGVIDTHADGYVLQVPREDIDVHRFDRAVADGQRRAAAGDWEAAVAAWTAAVGLWRGRPLVEVRDWPLVAGEIARLIEQYHRVQEDLAAAQLACGCHEAVVAGLEAMVSDEPLRERRWALLMTALDRSSRQAHALRAAPAGPDSARRGGPRAGL